MTDEYNKQKELEQLHRVFNRLDSKGDGKIDEQELGTYLRTYLGYKPKKGEVAEMIWQVDENGDGLLHWDEFSVMCAGPRRRTHPSTASTHAHLHLAPSARRSGLCARSEL